ncbi:MAG: A/G-specific adenine glycosylase [Pseudohongiella sp.]|nr:A/G-specific adenine glycosylase [Pseudohongiella sp.]
MPTLFNNRVLKWFDQHGRHDLPWQIEPSPFRVWVSEIMLQQTQVNTVIPYYQRFMQRFPTVEALAEAETDQVLHLWTGLGYYARARNLHKTAQLIASQYKGEFPHSVEQLKQLPGIGQSTAGAIAALSMHIKAPILDGNVKRVLTRFHAIEGWPEQSKVKSQLWILAEALLPKHQIAKYTQAMMDLGATVCTRSKPRCSDCPLHRDCEAFKQDLIASIPGKKASKTLPVKSVTLFILQNEAGEILLEKRPPSGIWGSLWSLPEGLPTGSNETEAAGSSHLPVRVKGEKPVELDKIRHTFSHFHLDITPMHLGFASNSNAVMDSQSWLWYPLDHSLEVGLAAPVKKLLSQLANGSVTKAG